MVQDTLAALRAGESVNLDRALVALEDSPTYGVTDEDDRFVVYEHAQDPVAFVYDDRISELTQVDADHDAVLDDRVGHLREARREVDDEEARTQPGMRSRTVYELDDIDADTYRERLADADAVDEGFEDIYATADDRVVISVDDEQVEIEAKGFRTPRKRLPAELHGGLALDTYTVWDADGSKIATVEHDTSDDDPFFDVEQAEDEFWDELPEAPYHAR